VWLVSGPEAEIKTNDAKHAAVVKRGAEREHRDLFAPRPPDLGSVKQTLRPPPPDSQLSGMAARNETSVLFTVDALRGNARLNTPAPETSPVSGFIVEDDEGIIDLNALASAPSARNGNRSVAPLFASELPPAAFAADVSNSGAGPGFSAGGFRFGKRAIAGVAAAAVALVLCAVGVSAVFKGEEPVARAAANTMIAAPPMPVVATPTPAAAAPAPVADPAPTATTATSDDDAKPAASGAKKKGRKGGAKASLASTQKVQSSGVPAPAAAAKTVPKAADKCGCKGDFNCILRCTATGK